jgi:hypothetical protein
MAELEELAQFLSPDSRIDLKVHLSSILFFISVLFFLIFSKKRGTVALVFASICDIWFQLFFPFSEAYRYHLLGFKGN